MMKINPNQWLQREDSVISADFETTHDCCASDDDTEESNKGMNLKEIINADTNNDLVIDVDPNAMAQLPNNENGTMNLTNDAVDGRAAIRKRVAHSCSENKSNWAEHKNVAEGLMDIALLSANANQLRFLITYNNKASTYFISLGLVAVSLALQVAVGIALIFKRRIKRSRTKRTHNRINEFLIGGVFVVTVVNVLLAAFTTTDN